MDCEKFDQHVIEALYDELDELTHAALKRHVEGCSRCAAVWAGLRATREVGILPLEEPPDDLEDRILEAAARAQRGAPWHKKVLRGLAWAGSHAMRPQLAMAALFFLVIGSSLLLLRARPGTLGPVSVTERGSPAPEPAEVAAGPHAAAAAPPAAMPTSAPAATAVAGDFRADREGEKRGASADAPAASSKSAGGDEARAALADARAARDSTGCAAAVAKLDAVAVTFRGTQAASDAMWDEASCYKQMGEAQKAQEIYLALRSTGYRERAEAQLAAAESNSNVQNRSAAGPLPAGVTAAPASPKAVAAGGLGGRAVAAPAPPAPKAARATKSAAPGDTDPHANAAPRKDLGFSP
jgi:hypothetical protein